MCGVCVRGDDGDDDNDDDGGDDGDDDVDDDVGDAALSLDDLVQSQCFGRTCGLIAPKTGRSTDVPSDLRAHHQSL